MNLNLPINSRPVLNQQPLFSPLNQTNLTSHINQIRHPNFPPPQIHYSPPIQYLPKNNFPLTPVQQQSPFNVQQRVQVKPVNNFNTFSSAKSGNMNGFNHVYQQTPIVSQVPTPQFYPTPQKQQLNPFEMIKGNQVSKIINDNQSSQ